MSPFRLPLALALVACLHSPAHALDTVSTNAAGSDTSNGTSYFARITPDGRYAVYFSSATDLVTGATDGNSGFDVFRRDLRDGVTALVSVNLAGTGTGNAGAADPAISADGRWVAFASTATDLVALPDANNDSDVFLRDLQTGSTTLVSRNVGGTAAANAFSEVEAISDDGRYLVFVSSATNLVATPDGNVGSDIFVHDRVAGSNTLVSVNAAGSASGNRSSYGDVCISRDGRYIVFISQASTLTADLVPGLNENVFRRDRVAATTTLVSVTAAGGSGGDAGSYTANRCVSDDGRHVLFHSDASNLSALDGDFEPDVYLRDVTSASTALVSVAADGVSGGNAASDRAMLSRDGRHVVFLSEATNLVATATADTQVFLRDRVAGTTRLLSDTPAGEAAHGTAAAATIDASATRVVIDTRATDMFALQDDNGGRDLFLRDVASGRRMALSAVEDATSTGDERSSDAQLADDGSVVFLSLASDLVRNDGNDVQDVFAFRPQVFGSGFE